MFGTGPLWSLTAAAVLLALAALVAARGSRDPLSSSLAALTTLLAAYKTLEYVSDAAGSPVWDQLELATAVASIIPALYFFLGFLGLRRRLRWPLRLASVYFLVLSVALGAGRLDPQAARTALLLLVGLVVAMGVIAVLLVAHVVRARGEGRLRGLLLLGVLGLGVGGASTDLAALAGASVPKLSQPGLLSAAVLMAVAASRHHMLTSDRLMILTIGALSIVVVLAQFLVLAWAGTEAGLIVAGTVVVLLLTVLAAQPLWSAWSEQRSRQEYLATLGRLSGQMAHDLRNPLSAIRSAGELLVEEERRSQSSAGGAGGARLDYLRLIVDQTHRMERVLADYQRLGRCEAEPVPLDLGALLQPIVAGQPPGSCSLQLGPRKTSADPELLTIAVENLVRNAREASSSEELVLVRTGAAPAEIFIEVADRGHGMDAAMAERALDDFFTTRAEGSGLGLPYARRVAEAHGGRLEIDSHLGKGTTVRLFLPELRVEAPR